MGACGRQWDVAVLFGPTSHFGVRKELLAPCPSHAAIAVRTLNEGTGCRRKTRFCELPQSRRRLCSLLSLVMFYLCSKDRHASGGRRYVVRRSARRPVSRVLYPPRTAGDDHSSGTSVAGRLARPTRTAARKPACRLAFAGCRRAVPIWSCSRWGLPCRRRRRRRGALLPHPFTLAGGPQPRPAVCFLWHCPWGRPRRALPGTVFPWSPDFPPPPPRAAKAAIRPSGALDDSRETALSKIGADRCDGAGAGSRRSIGRRCRCRSPANSSENRRVPSSPARRPHRRSRARSNGRLLPSPQTVKGAPSVTGRWPRNSNPLIARSGHDRTANPTISVASSGP